MSLKTKITLVVMLLLVGCLALLAFAVERRLSRNMQALLAGQQFSTATYIASDLDGKIRLRLELLESAAEAVTPALLADPDRAREFLASHANLLKLFRSGLTLISRDGLGVADYPPAPGRVGASFASQEYFREISATGRSAVGKPQVGRFTRSPGVVFGAPVKDADGALLGVLAGYASLAEDTLFGQAQDTRLGRTGYIAIDVPKYGIIATCSDPSRIMQPMAEPGQNPMLDKFVAGYEGSGVAVNSLGVEVLTSGKQIPSTGWIAQLVLPVEEAFAPIRNLRLRVYGLGGFLALASLAVLWLVIGRLLAPLVRASRSVREMSSGQREFETLPVDHHDEVGRLLANFNLLVEERQRFEGALADREAFILDVLDSIPAHVAILDREGAITASNEAWKRFGRENGLPESYWAEPRNYLDVCEVGVWAVDADLAARARHGISAVLKGEERQFALDYPCHSATARRWFSLNARPLSKTASGGLVVMHSDVSRIKEIEESLREAQGMLEVKVRERTEELNLTMENLRLAMENLRRAKDQADSLNGMKTEFLANVSHELRTPLIPILGLTELLLDSALTPEQRDYLGEARKAAERLNAMISDLIELTGMDVYLPSLGPLNLKTILDIVRREMTPLAGAKGLDLQIGQGEGLPGLVLADMTLLRLVLSKLVGNAIKFTPAGRVLVSAALAGWEGDRAMVQFLVADTGVGIPGDRLQEIIFGLTQAENPMIKRFGGLGLGLAAVRKAVLILGGRVEVESEPGQGSIFKVLLPFQNCTEERLDRCIEK